MTYPNTPCCDEGPTILRHGHDSDGENGVLRGYRCEKCGEKHEACAAELSDGGHCRRLATECSYHED